MKKNICIVAFCFSLSWCFGQPVHDTITIIRRFGGTQFYQGNECLTIKRLSDILEPNQAAFLEFRKARTAGTFSSIFAVAGGFLIGYPLGTAIAGGEPDWTLAGIGAGLVVVGIPISVSAGKHTRNAVLIFNEDIKALLSHEPSLRLFLGINRDGPGVALRF